MNIVIITKDFSFQLPLILVKMKCGTKFFVRGVWKFLMSFVCGGGLDVRGVYLRKGGGLKPL